MAKHLTQIHIHTQYAHKGIDSLTASDGVSRSIPRRPKKVYRRLSGVQALKPNRHRFTHQASVVYDGKNLRIYLDMEGEWHGYPFSADLDFQAKEVKTR